MTLAHRFRNPDLEQLALRHRSAGRSNNERLEFFGDALVNLVVSEALLERFPRADEGALTRVRSQLVRESTLASVARRLQLGDRLELGPGELKSGGFRRDSILADAVEALAAAVYLDAGFDAVRLAVLAWLAPELESATLDDGKDAKTRLQEWLQARQYALPRYSIEGTEGDEHDRQFRVRCEISMPPLAVEAEGRSRRSAEQSAAAAMLGRLGEST